MFAFRRTFRVRVLAADAVGFCVERRSRPCVGFVDPGQTVLFAIRTPGALKIRQQKSSLSYQTFWTTWRFVNRPSPVAVRRTPAAP
jgi:hypothetical protein